MTEQSKTVSKIFEGRNVLVVDDEVMVSKFISALLTSRGCNVTAINNSVEALAYFNQHHQNIDLVITDQTMPEMNGSELASEMLIINPDATIFIATGYSEEINEEIAKKMGISSFLTKPIKSATLLKQLSTIF